MRPAGLDEERAERFDDWFRSHYVRVLAYARRRLSDRVAAEDIAAETFVVAWRRLEDAPTDVLPWLLAIARGLILNEVRAGRRRDRLLLRVGAEPEDARIDEPQGSQAPAPGEAPRPGEQEASPVLAALARLSEVDREVLLLAAWDALDHRRASQVLGCSRGAYTVRLHRARVRLARELATQAHPRPDQPEEER